MKKYVLAASMGLATIAACTHVSAVNQPRAYLGIQSPIEVWIVRRHNDSVYRMSQPRLQGDTLIGFLLPSPGEPLTRYEEIPLNDVRQMRARQSAPTRTALLVAGIGGAAYLAYAELIGGGGSGATVFCECDFDDICACP